jgi:hypothetical protein
MRLICATLLAASPLVSLAQVTEGPQVQPVQIDASRPDWENPSPVAVHGRGHNSRQGTPRTRHRIVIPRLLCAAAPDECHYQLAMIQSEVELVDEFCS